MQSDNFDPAKYGKTLPEWRMLSRRERRNLRFKYKRLQQLAENPAFERERYWANAEKRRASRRRSYYKHHAYQLERNAKRWAKHRSLKTLSEHPNVIFRQVMGLLPPTLPRDARDDIAGTVMLAVLEGKLLVKDLSSRLPEFVRAHNRENDPYKTRSLNETLPGSRLEWIDTLTVEDQPW